MIMIRESRAVEERKSDNGGGVDCEEEENDDNDNDNEPSLLAQKASLEKRKRPSISGSGFDRSE